MIVTLDALALQLATEGASAFSLAELETFASYGRWLKITREGQQQMAEALAAAEQLAALALAIPAEGARPS